MRPSSRDEFAVAIICALTLEVEAVEALFNKTYNRPSESYKKQPGDNNAYFTSRIRNHKMVLYYMPYMRKGNAASMTASLKISYQGIQVTLVISIYRDTPCTLDKEETFLGDVIISNTVIEYNFSRQYQHRFKQKTGIKNMLK